MEIRPFPVIHYPFDPKLLSKVVCPPYDKLSDSQISSFRKLDPRNFVHAIIGERLADHDYHETAAATLRGWVREGVLLREEKEQLLVCRQSFKCPLSGRMVTRTGFFALLRLPERGEGGVLPHERTFAEHKADRLSLYRSVKGTPEPIFVLYPDPDRKVLEIMNQGGSGVSFTDAEGHCNELVLLEDAKAIDAIRGLIEPQNLLIADGHHRYETGQNYRDECRTAHPDASGPQPWDFILVYFTAIEDPGLVILPTHRLVKGVSPANIEALLSHSTDFFDIDQREFPVSVQGIHDAAASLADLEKGRESLALVTRQSICFLHLRDQEKIKTLLSSDLAGPLRDLPVVWLHRVLLDRFLELVQEEGAPDRLGYVRTADEVYSGLTSGGFDVAFLLRGTHPEEVKMVAEAGLRMPQKSTDFFPKVPSGITAYLHSV
jgi:uncharacterized protein (DUF1015 family)